MVEITKEAFQSWMKVREDERVVEVNPRYLIGVLREMYMEWFQHGLRVSNTYQIPMDSWHLRPHSIQMLEQVLEDVLGEWEMVNWRNDIFLQYNEGRRACV